MVKKVSQKEVLEIAKHLAEGIQAGFFVASGEENQEELDRAAINILQYFSQEHEYMDRMRRVEK